MEFKKYTVCPSKEQAEHNITLINSRMKSDGLLYAKTCSWFTPKEVGIGKIQAFRNIKFYYLTPDVKYLMGIKPYNQSEIEQSLVDNTLEDHIKFTYISQHKVYGVEYREDLRSWIIAKYYREEISFDDAVYIDEVLAPVIPFITNGDWASTKKKVDTFVVDAVFTQEIKDKILFDLNTYISENY